MILLDDNMGINISFSDLSRLILVIGACLAIIGAVVIYKKWSLGNHNIENDVLYWGGGILMLIIVQAFIRVMFIGYV
ncbi:DUF4134 family protein [Arachidicoccus soli]|uniref:DUF4134 domain-containing protein n=1 Tax=Arachidicoccus soli TaxID=2341117 RepID=A0A386HUC6_9BACT|nr:DUF4134 domain-containing protein [Arachidicoccus soli]